jgi:hypothetical protein
LTPWWFWMIWKPAYPGGPLEYFAAGPYQMTTKEAFDTHFRMRSEYFTPHIYRWIWDPATPALGWRVDWRTDTELLASI